MSVTALSAPERLSARPLQWKWLVAALTVLAVTYLSMLNRYWVPSGDGEVYVCIARSLIQKHGLEFNGAKAAIAPPGWPLVLSWLMRISPQFWFLKVAIITSMLGGFASVFFILRRFASDRAAAGIVMLTGTLSSIYPLTYWTHTEAFFCLLGFAALLIAFRISEGRARLFWEVPAMLLLLGFGAFTRWPGLLHLVLVIPILLSGAKRRPWKRASTWAYIGVVLIACVGTFAATYQYLSLTKAEKRLALVSGGASENETDADVTVTANETGTGEATTGPTTAAVGSDSSVPVGGDVFGNGKRSALGEVYFRFSSAGRWFAWLLWQPTRFGQSVRIIDSSGLLFGWLVIVLLFITMIRSALRYDFFWIGLAVYTGGLCMLWPNPTARYFVPVAPFIVLGIYRGIGETSHWLTARRKTSVAVPTERLPNLAAPTIAYALPQTDNAEFGSPSISPTTWLKPFRALWIVFIAATLVSNLPLLAIDIRVFRSSDFYGQYEAGANKGLLEIAQYIREHPQPDGTVAVHEFYDNMGRKRYSKFGVRALHLLLNEPIIPVERQNKLLNLKPNDDVLRKWLRKPDQNSWYCITQDSWTPWRVWHFRLTPKLQEWLTKRPVPKETGGWELWSRASTRFETDDVPERFIAPTRVPGL